MTSRILYTLATLLLLVACSDKPTEPAGSFSITVASDPTPIGSIVTYTVANNTKQTVYLDPCPGVFAEQLQPDDSWQQVWSEVSMNDCAVSFVEPLGMEPGSSFTPRCGAFRCGPSFDQPGVYRLGIVATSDLSDWTRPPVYSNKFEVE